MAKALTTEQEALDEVIAKVNEAIGNRWMVAVWIVAEDEKGKPNKTEPMRKITWKFPTEDFQKAVEQLKQTIDEEVSADEPPVPEPLKLADFGKEEVENEKPVPLVVDAPPVELELTPKERSGPMLPGSPMSIGEFMNKREQGEEE
jgi:hypothetical protein